MGRHQVNSSYSDEEYAAIAREASLLGMGVGAWQRLIVLDAAGIEDARAEPTARPLTAREAAQYRFVAGELASMSVQFMQLADSHERAVPEPVELAAEVFAGESVLDGGGSRA